MLLGGRLARRASTTTTSAALLPASADVVVIGGGSVGASAAYHLAARGLRTVLLEAHTLTAGTTWHTAGMLWRLRPSYVDVELHEKTRMRCLELEDALEEIEKETPGSRRGSIFSANGGLFVATTRERLAEYERLAEMGKFYNIEAHMVSPAESRDIHPLLNVDDLVGSMYSPGDGTIDASNVCDAYRRVAKARFGAIFAEHTRCARIETCEGVFRRHVRAVVTEDGRRIETRNVVNAAGAWANDVLATLDSPIPDLPLLAMKHAYVVTESIPDLQEALSSSSSSSKAIPNVRDHELSIYVKAQGDALALGGYETNPEFRRVTPDFAFSLYDLDWETFSQNLEGHFRRCPVVEDVGVKSTVCGPESFTPDHKPLVGPSPDLGGLFLACGFNSMGMMLAGGVGEHLAEYVCDGGATSADLFALDPRRFHASCSRDPKWVKRTTHESYAKTYAIVFPHDEPLAGRLHRTSALHEALADRGCVFQSRHGFERPGWFVPNRQERLEPLPYDYYGAYDDDDAAWRLDWKGDIAESTRRHATNPYNDVVEGELAFGWGKSFGLVAAECRAARNSAVVFDQSYFGKFELAGPQAEAAARHVCAAALRPGVGQTTYTPLCNANGGVEADLTVTRLRNGNLYFVSGGSTCSRDAAWIRDNINRFDATLVDRSDDFAVISVQGPLSRRVLAPLVDGARLGPPTIDPTFDMDAFLPFSFALENVTVAGVPGVRVIRLTFVGELGFELHAPYDRAKEIYAAIGAVDAGYRAMDSLSAEKGYRHWHADLSNAETPFEAAIGFAVAPRLKNTSRDVDDFIGRAALEEARKAGVFSRKRLVCLSINDDDDDGEPFSVEPPANAAPLHGAETLWYDDDTCVGLVRSTAFSHALRKTIAYGYVHADQVSHLHQKLTPDFLKSGTWSIGDRGARRPATLHLKPPVDPTNDRVKTVAA